MRRLFNVGTDPGWKLALRAIFRALTFLLSFAFAGRLNWWRGWLCVGSLLLIAGVSSAVLRRKSPDLMRRRLEWQPGVKGFERFVLAATIVGFLSVYAVAASTPATAGRNSARPGYGLASRWSYWDRTHLPGDRRESLPRKAGPRSDRAWLSRHQHGTVPRGASPHVMGVRLKVEQNQLVGVLV